MLLIICGIHTEITCSQLGEPEQGLIAYSPDDDGSPYSLGVSATYSCDSGFLLQNGDEVRVCQHDGISVSGEWSGSAPECVGECKECAFN